MKVYTKQEVDALELDEVTERWIAYYPTEVHQKNNNIWWSPISEIKLTREWNKNFNRELLTALLWGKPKK